MGPFNIFGSLNIKLSDRFSKRVIDAIGIYFLTWLILEIIFWVSLGVIDFFQAAFYWGTYEFNLSLGLPLPTTIGIINLFPLLNGFTLFNYLPYWLRLIMLIFLTIGVINIPISIFAFFLSADPDIGSNKNSLVSLGINCVDCQNHISGEWPSGVSDIRCGRCFALMTLTIERGSFEKLSLKQSRKYG
jgi:hypothetical protein